jgi:ubiquinone/menaquinone biosynthesis C-methylase UbiE
LEDHSKDLFSKQSKKYAISRPTYPKALIDYIVGLVEQKRLAWDCATGSGQAAVALSTYFEQVIASDISVRQLENAQHRNNIRYEVFPAEKTPFTENSIDLIAVAQALHWFEFDRFYGEVNRILRRKGGVLAAWAYGLHSVSPEIDVITHNLYEDVLGPYWPAERKHIEAKYETIPFPFEQIVVPEFQIELLWDARSLIDYIYTWSSVQKFIEKNNQDPVMAFIPQIEKAWGVKEDRRKVVWPLYIKAGRLKH